MVMMINNSKNFGKYALLTGLTIIAVLNHTEDQAGFISLDCGIETDSGYNDETTEITYISDEKFIDTGISKSISSEFHTGTIEKQFHTVRSFPEGERNCYTLNPEQGKENKYLIRAGFMYGNYDGLNQIPEFDLYVGVNIWDAIHFNKNASSIVTTEIIHVPSTNYIHVCLVNTGYGTPFISSLELRLLDNSTYTTESRDESLVLRRRCDFGSLSNESVRFHHDMYDRIWMPENNPDWIIMSNSESSYDVKGPVSKYRPPGHVMETAIMTNGLLADSMDLLYDSKVFSKNPNSQYYIYLYFAELEDLLELGETREFNISLNGDFFHGPVAPQYLKTTTIFNTKPKSGDRVQLRIYSTERSTVSPIINALEIYMVRHSSQLQSDQDDVEAITSIKSKYGVKKHWQGDPCAPKAYRWDGLGCSYVDNSPPRITSLDLSSSGLSGEIAPEFAKLTSLQSLDLSNNSLSGKVPEFLSQLTYLTILNLSNNKLTGSLPAKLMERLNNGSLTLSVDENPNICLLPPCKIKKNKSIVVPLVAASLAALSAVLLAVLVIFCILKRRRKKQVVQKPESELQRCDSFASKNRQFSYSDILEITKNFEAVLGRGGFGSVYHGYLDDNQVAVKMLSSSSTQGYKEFNAEVKLLMRVHHRNLTTLVGFCIEGINMGLIYEYMANGTLRQHLSARNGDILSWKDRLLIAVDAAQGLEYLHNGCKPPIVHRDVKSTNILLNETLQAKISDFGLSRIFPSEGGTHISTVVAGTPGYLDPEYSVSNRLSEKSDVYSFGIVLLEIITSQSVIVKSSENTHISQWVTSTLAEGDIRNIVDKRLEGNYNINSVWKATELALVCASHTSSKRPTMTAVVMELNECLAILVDRDDESCEKMASVDMCTDFFPLAR